MINDILVFIFIFRYKYIFVEFDIICVNFFVGWEIQEGFVLDLFFVMQNLGFMYNVLEQNVYYFYFQNRKIVYYYIKFCNFNICSVIEIFKN